MSGTPRVIQVTLDITVDDKKLYSAPTAVAAIAQEVARSAISIVDESSSAVSAAKVDVRWAWIYAWASGQSTVSAVEDDLDPSAPNGD